ncbi:MAG: thiol reductant ABC exporter subunit CydC [Candidatus Dormibacter sp.]|uniref:thiol reductant ABC exporter subunit CydC n=1 Tax=Candidatus Dormibacter sp. TaxID=2973982 RepID=UPI000DAFC406|nr:MAG: thiol reductant ABC exporter subunit CydC [Candidatus Dormibacteraeota bacterium]
MKRYLLGLAAPVRGGLTLATLALAGTLASGIALLATSGYLISKAALRPPVLELTVVIVAVRAFALVRALFRYGERVLSHELALELLVELRVRLFSRLRRLAPAGLESFRSADLLQRLVGDVESMQDFFLRVVSPPLAAALTLLVAATVLWPIAPAATLNLLVAAGSAGVALPLLAQRLSRLPARRQAELRGQLRTQVEELLRAQREIVAFGRQAHHLHNLASGDRALAREDRRLAWSSAALEGAVLTVAGLALASALWLLAGSGQTQGVWLASAALVTLASFEAVQPLPAAFQKLAQVNASAQRLREIETAPVPVPEGRGGLPAQPGDVKLEGAWLRYRPEAEWALRNAHLTLRAGRRYALIGPSGCGKSTLARALVRLRDLDRGTATLGGVDLRRLDPESVQKVVGVCAQDAHIFNATLAANLKLGRPQAGWADVKRAARQAGLLDWIERLPAGFQTRVGAGGEALSGGQRQRLSLARTLLMDFPIVILDEPTANLDEATATALLHDIWRALDGRTVLLITHRLRGLEAVDEVLVMESGRIVECGRESELRQRDGLYAELCRLAA